MSTLAYYSYKAYIKKTYNKALFSVAVDLDLGCPNREIDGSGGCTFCPVNGARAAQTLNAKTIEEQILKGVSFAKQRYKAEHFMLYIQAYTGTFTSVINQKNTYSKLLKLYNFDAISIGTRPDCLNTSTLEYLKELNQEIDVHVDLGIQTLNDKTLKNINRGHDSKTSIESIRKLKEYGIKVFAHVIVGFENENREDWEHTVKVLVKEKVDGIKIHNLHIIKNTQMAKEYDEKKFTILNEYEYAEELIYLIRNIPSNIPIIRISTDTIKNDLIAPIWNMQKGQFAEYVNEQMIYRGLRQADLIEKIEELDYETIKTTKLEDGSITAWDQKFRDYYHPKSGAYRQANELFINKSKLQEKLKYKDIKLLDIGFGMGYNSLAALNIEKAFNLEITALDKNRNIVLSSSNVINNEKESNILKEIYKDGFYQNKNNQIKIHFADIRYSLQKLKDSFDIIFLDAFIHTQNSSMISIEVFKLLKNLLKNDGTLVCSSSTEVIRVALSQTGFKSEISNIHNSDIKGIVAMHGDEKIEGIPYKDPYLVYRDKQILTNRENDLKNIK